MFGTLYLLTMFDANVWRRRTPAPLIASNASYLRPARVGHLSPGLISEFLLERGGYDTLWDRTSESPVSLACLYDSLESIWAATATL